MINASNITDIFFIFLITSYIRENLQLNTSGKQRNQQTNKNQERTRVQRRTHIKVQVSILSSIFVWFVNIFFTLSNSSVRVRMNQ